MTELHVAERGRLRIDHLPDPALARLATLEGVDVRFHGGALHLQAGGMVGRFELADDITLVVAPKATSATTALDMMARLRRLDSLEITPDTHGASQDLCRALIRAQLDAIRRVWRYGLLRGYRRRTEELASVRGRLRPVETVLPGPMSRGRVVCEHHPRSLDISENVVLRWVTHSLGARLTSMPGLAREARALDVRLHQVPLRRVTARQAAAGRRSGAFGAYTRALALAELLLSDASWSEHTGGGGGFSWAIDMDRLFQDWLASVLREALPSAGVTVTDQLTLALARRGSSRIHGRPDLVLERRGRPIAVLDAKHIVLSSPSASHLQQVIAYATHLGLDRAWLVHPTAPGTERPLRSWRVPRQGRVDLEVVLGPVRLWGGTAVAEDDVRQIAVEVLRLAQGAARSPAHRRSIGRT